MEKSAFSMGEESGPKGPKLKPSEYMSTVSKHPLSFAGHLAAGLGGGYAAGAGLGALATIPIAATRALAAGKGKFNAVAAKEFKEKMWHGLQSESVGFGGVGLVAGAGKFFNKYKNETPDMKERMEHIKHAAFLDELEKIAKNPVAVSAGKGGKWGAIIGGGSAGLVSRQVMKELIKKFPNASKSRTAVIAASMLAGAIAGGEAGGYIGAGVGGAEKVTSHLYGAQSQHK
jgi:hypothetical protein